MKWKYKILRLWGYDGLMEKKINELGEEGWELVRFFSIPPSSVYRNDGEYIFIFKMGGE